MENLFKEVNVDKVTDKIVHQLESLIQDGKLMPGDKLPSERQLINILGVGRSSLREALYKLETIGYVEIKKRKGVFVKSINSTFQLDPFKRMMHGNEVQIVQLYEIRSDIEQATAYAAALERNDEDLEEISKCLENFQSKDKRSLFKWEFDQAFHCAIARASHNIFRIHVIMDIFNFSKEFIQPIIEDFANAREYSGTIAEQHASLFNAIKEKNAEEARERMKEHLDLTNFQLIEHFQSSIDATSKQ